MLIILIYVVKMVIYSNSRTKFRKRVLSFHICSFVARSTKLFWVEALVSFNIRLCVLKKSRIW